MIKVEHTKTHRANDFPFGAQKDKLVTDAKLVLVECEQGYINSIHIISRIDNSFDTHNWVKPILISETEKIEVGDWVLCYYHDGSNTVRQVKSETDVLWIDDKGTGWFKNTAIYKILALPEHFSPQQLQMIVDGKLKDGDKVLVESERCVEPHLITQSSKEYFIIKLNPHITIYSVEEKMYTREECKKLCIKAYEEGQSNWDGYAGRAEQVIDNEWFEQNVK